MTKMPRVVMPSVWDQRLMCHVDKLEFVFATGTGRLYLAPANCCDMRGAIEMFTSLCRDVARIETFAGKKRDTTYIKGDAGWDPLNLCLVVSLF